MSTRYEDRVVRHRHDGSGSLPVWPLARRSRQFETSPWDAPAALSGRHPAPLSLASGAPSESLVPQERLRQAAQCVWAESNPFAYAGASGYAPLRDWLVGWLTERHVHADADEIVLTTGSQQGIDLVARVFLDPGDVVVVEGPTYIGALQVFDSYEATYLTVPMDEHGLDADVLDTMLAARAVARQPIPKLLYSVPTYQNPTGRMMSEDRRRAVLDVAQRYGLVVVEDDPYGEIRFNDVVVPSLRALDPNVIVLGTFSKTIAPALRVGWLVAPPELATLLANAREVNDVHGDRMSQRIVAWAVQGGFLDEHVGMLRHAYRERRDTLVGALRPNLPQQVDMLVPEGGFFVWLSLPDGLDASAMLPDVATYGVAYIPGGWCYPDRRPDSGIRLSFASLPLDDLGESAQRLGAALAQAVNR